MNWVVIKPLWSSSQTISGVCYKAETLIDRRSSLRRVDVQFPSSSGCSKHALSQFAEPAQCSRSNCWYYSSNSKSGLQHAAKNYATRLSGASLKPSRRTVSHNPMHRGNKTNNIAGAKSEGKIDKKKGEEKTHRHTKIASQMWSWNGIKIKR